MNIFMDKEKVSVKKIKETSDGWNLYPTDRDDAPIFISKKNYSGKMPPFFRWPWQEVELELTSVGEFQVSAALDGHTLFEISEKDYPAAVKELLEQGEVLHQEAVASVKKRDDAIKEALAAYLKVVPCNPNLESELSFLKLCLRVYMKMHLFKGTSGQDRLQRLNLMMLICQIVQRIYTRHVDEKATFGITMASFGYSLRCDFPHYAARMEDYERVAKENGIPEVILAVS